MLEGRKTYIGLAIALAGVLGLFRYVSEGDLTAILNTGAEFIGLVFAAYGRYKTRK